MVRDRQDEEALFSEALEAIWKEEREQEESEFEEEVSEEEDNMIVDPDYGSTSEEKSSEEEEPSEIDDFHSKDGSLIWLPIPPGD